MHYSEGLVHCSKGPVDCSEGQVSTLLFKGSVHYSVSEGSI